MANLDKDNTASAPWWRGAVIYEIYVRSFFDANGDGQGDLPGLIAKLDYIQRLGADAIWLSPIHPSPNRDWGYDVSDYDGVHPDFGTMADFERFAAEAHKRGIKILLDAVLSHTSDEHAWFKESLAARDSRKADWYVWADPKPDGTAPNNWLSAFGGPAWSYHPVRRQHYFHKFLRQQPKLNWHNEEARTAALRVLITWLQRGVDGFRLDVANSYLHDASLADNPAVPLAKRTPWNWAHAANLQSHIHDANLPENPAALAAIRRTVDAFESRFVMGEFFEYAETSGGYLPADKGLHSSYDFDFLDLHALKPDNIRDYFIKLSRNSSYWPTIVFSNHDVVRTVTRLGGAGAGAGFAKLALALLLTLKGTILLYQGEELGLPEAELARDQLKDPFGDLYYPFFKGRDGCRTPMPWDGNAPALGFSTGTPWLPVSPAHRPLAIAAQEKDQNSVLHFARAVLAARRKSAALRLGEIDFAEAPGELLVYERRHENKIVLCVFNLGTARASLRDPRIDRAKKLLATGETHADRASLTLDPLAAWIGDL
jgi:alpha-glucosidase